MYKKLLLIFVIFLFFGSLAVYLLKPRPQPEKALEYLTQNAWTEAERVLALKGGPFPLAFYRGYIAQLKGRFHEADLLFQAALKTPVKSSQKDLFLSELAFAQAINSYYEGQNETLASFLEKLCKLTPDHCLIPFFEGLDLYLKQQYGEAFETWNSFNTPSFTSGSGWQSFIFERHFPPSWRAIRLAHCLIETGDLVKGRTLLENSVHTLCTDQAEALLCNLFLGLTYLKESQKVPFEQRASFYKLAFFYFDRSEKCEHFEREKNQVIFHVQKEAINLLTSSVRLEGKKWGFDLVRILEKWDAKSAIESIACELSQSILKEKDFGLCTAIREGFLDTFFQTQVTQKMLVAISNGLKKGEIEDLFEYWAMMEAVTLNPTALAKEIADLSSEEIFQTVNRDDLSLAGTLRYIAFWEKLGRSTQEKERLAREFLFHSKLFWQKEGQEKKGLRLMDLAFGLSQSVHTEIEAFLTTLYNEAEGSNMIGRLSCIYDGLEHFNISRKELLNPTKIANYLADAEYQYLTRNFYAAHTQATWVLKLDSKNEGALRIAGLSSFHVGEYAKAYAALKSLKAPDEPSKKALVLSEAFATQKEEKHLAQIDHLDVFVEDE